jgi:hypothetical protein
MNEISSISIERTGRGLEFSDTDLIAFIQRYAELKKSADRLRYSEFCSAIAPKDSFYLNTLA